MSISEIKDPEARRRATRIPPTVEFRIITFGPDRTGNRFHEGHIIRYYTAFHDDGSVRVAKNELWRSFVCHTSYRDAQAAAEAWLAERNFPFTNADSPAHRKES